MNSSKSHPWTPQSLTHELRKGPKALPVVPLLPGFLRFYSMSRRLDGCPTVPIWAEKEGPGPWFVPSWKLGRATRKACYARGCQAASFWRFQLRVNSKPNGNSKNNFFFAVALVQPGSCHTPLPTLCNFSDVGGFYTFSNCAAKAFYPFP